MKSLKKDEHWATGISKPKNIYIVDSNIYILQSGYLNEIIMQRILRIKIQSED